MAKNQVVTEQAIIRIEIEARLIRFAEYCADNGISFVTLLHLPEEDNQKNHIFAENITGKDSDTIKEIHNIVAFKSVITGEIG